MKIKLTNKKKVYNFCKPYIIAELGSNHNGDMELAKKLIIQAKEAGADCVKFQSWSKDTIFTKKKYEDNYFIADDYRDRTDYTLEEIVEAYSISEEELLEMKKFADELGIDCTSTPFSKKEADFLIDKLDSPFIKVASMDLNNYPFLEYLAKKNKPMVIATGLSELYEIDKAVKTIENAGNKNIIILHCVSTYPPVDSDVHLNNIKTLMTTYPEYPIGFSDHTLGTTAPVVATTLGAKVIEKHFILDKSIGGADAEFSLDKKEFEEMIKAVRDAEKLMGKVDYSMTEKKKKSRQFARSLYVSKDIKKDEIITEENIRSVRPGYGLHPKYLKDVLGKKVNKNLKKDIAFKLEFTYENC